MRRTALLLFFLGVAAAPGCDGACEPPPATPGNQDPASLAVCPALPPGVEPIPGLSVARASERFGGLVLTLSTRPLACGEPAAQHDYCDGDDDRGVSFGLPAAQSVVGAVEIGHPVYIEYETPTRLSVGGSIDGASLEIFAITDSCVTGRIVGLAAHEGPFDGGFQAPRCTP